jgi:hypothetical protein
VVIVFDEMLEMQVPVVLDQGLHERADIAITEPSLASPAYQVFLGCLAASYNLCKDTCLS